MSWTRVVKSCDTSLQRRYITQHDIPWNHPVQGTTYLYMISQCDISNWKDSYIWYLPSKKDIASRDLSFQGNIFSCNIAFLKEQHILTYLISKAWHIFMWYPLLKQGHILMWYILSKEGHILTSTYKYNDDGNGDDNDNDDERQILRS